MLEFSNKVSMKVICRSHGVSANHLTLTSDALYTRYRDEPASCSACSWKIMNSRNINKHREDEKSLQNEFLSLFNVHHQASTHNL